MTSAAAQALHIYLLGEFNLLTDGKQLTGLVAERPQTLLTYLLLNRHTPQSRQQIAFMLWPDSSDSQARTNLRNLLHTLRQVLPQADDFLRVEPLTLQWQVDAPFTLDVAQFEEALQQADETEDAFEMRHCLATAVSLYRGDLLPGNYDDWIIPHRETLRQRFLSALEKLIRLLEQAGDYRTAIHHCQRLLQQDPLNETTYIQLMRLHAQSNDRAGVRRTYQTCVATLEAELGVAPAAATQAAYEQLLRLEMVLPEEMVAAPSPPTPTATLRPRPLPVPPTPFIGREAELAEIAELLADPACRLLTIVGLGGMGKTRLALQTAVGHQPIFPDGVVFVTLAPLQTADLLVTAIGEALQFTFFTSRDPSAQLFSYLSQKTMLLVLDNFEHLLDGADLLADLMAHAPQIKLLVTSRQRLELQGEWVYEIGGFSLPENTNGAGQLQNSALALFHQSARRSDSHFAFTAEEEQHAARICHLVGGMPLAIELAASWVRLLSCAEIAGEIERGLAFLAVSLRNIPERHRSIQTVFDHSWNLLSPQEQAALAQLSVFRGGFSREAAEQVTGVTLPLLSALVDKSLVRRIETNRYDLHELIRQYAYEQLTQSCDFEAANNRHFEFFLALAEETRTRLRSSELISALTVLERDYDNLRSALEWSLREREESGTTPFEAYRGQKALRLTAALYLFWKIRVYWGNGRQWLQRALDLAAQAPTAPEQVAALKAAALLAVEQVDLPAAKQMAGRALDLARELGDPLDIGLTLATIGIVLWKQKEYDAARSHCEEALALFRQLNATMSAADSLQLLGRIAINQGNLSNAQSYLEESLTIFEELDDKMGFNAVLSDLGLVAYLRQDFAAARNYHSQSLKLFREARSLAGIEMTLNRLGDIARCEGDYDEAGRCYRECWAIFRDTGDKDEIPSLLHNLGCVALHEGDHAEAMNLFRQGMAMHTEMGNQAGMAECLAGIAAVHTAQGQNEAAAHLFGAAETLREKSNTVFWPANRLEYERSLAALRESLDEAAIAAAWATGRSMTVEQINQFLFPELLNA